MLPAPGSYFKHFKTGQVVRVLFVGRDVTKPMSHLSVAYIPADKPTTQPEIRRLTNFLEMVAPGLSRYSQCDATGRPLTQ